MIESEFPKLAACQEREWCQKWFAEYRKRPKRSDDDDLEMSEKLALLISEYREIERLSEYEHPDD